LRFRDRRSLPVAAFLVLTLLLVIVNIAAAVDPLAEGLRATYYTDTEWKSAPARSAVDLLPSTYQLFLAWRGFPAQSFSATWSGYIVALRSGTYTFATTSDDGSQVHIDQRLVVDNGGRHSAQTVRGSVTLTRGVHRILITYVQYGGPLELQLSWARDHDQTDSLRPVPSWAFAPTPATFTRFVISVAVRVLAKGLVWPWLATACVALIAAMTNTVRHALVLRDFAAAFEWTLIFGAAFVLLFVLKHEIGSDGRIRYFALAQLIEWRELSGTLYSLVGPLCSAPFYFLGRFVASSEWWCARFNTIVFLGGIAVAWQLLRTDISSGLFRKFALILMTASMFPYHVEGYFGEVFTATLVAVGLLAVQFGHRFAGWSAAIIGVANTPATIVGLAVAALVESWKTRRLRHLLPVIAAAMLMMIESWIRRGSPFVSGYEGAAGARTVLTYSGRAGFSYPLFFGLLSVLFSFGKGVFFYAPGLLLPVRKHVRAASARLSGSYDLWLAFLAGLILIYSKWWAWFGGWTWGPRFFLVASIPASCALAIALHRFHDLNLPRRFAVFAALTLSAWVAIDGAVFEMAGLNLCLDDTFAPFCWYVPEFSPLWRPFVEHTALTRPQWLVALYFGAVYVWLAAPLMADLWRRTVSIGFERWRALTTGEPWRI
jgi:hypothetical protein